jgi:hypothetical protein
MAKPKDKRNIHMTQRISLIFRSNKRGLKKAHSSLSAKQMEIFLTPSTYYKLDVLSEKTGKTKNELIEDALRQYIQRQGFVEIHSYEK